jgi:hypothetical protein
VSHELNEPIVERTDNKALLTGAFSDNFLFGQGVPNGLPTQQNWKHFAHYNGNCHELPYSSYKPVILEKD